MGGGRRGLIWGSFAAELSKVKAFFDPKVVSFAILLSPPFGVPL